jgi:hypothetical protein
VFLVASDVNGVSKWRLSHLWRHWLALPVVEPTLPLIVNHIGISSWDGALRALRRLAESCKQKKKSVLMQMNLMARLLR